MFNWGWVPWRLIVCISWLMEDFCLIFIIVHLINNFCSIVFVIDVGLCLICWIWMAIVKQFFKEGILKECLCRRSQPNKWYIESSVEHDAVRNSKRTRCDWKFKTHMMWLEIQTAYETTWVWFGNYKIVHDTVCDWYSAALKLAV